MNNKLEQVYREIELPLIPILVRMERYGATIDADLVSSLQSKFEAEQVRVRAEIQDMAGKEINLKAPKQVSWFIFEHLGLTPPKVKGKIPFTNEGYISTDEKTVLQEMPFHPGISLVREHRAYEKLRGSYLEHMANPHPVSGKVHTRFNQTRTRSYRLSSSDPLNLQNIPVRKKDLGGTTEEGEEIIIPFGEGEKLRQCFIPSEGRVILKADEDQMELRFETGLSQDPVKLDIYAKDGDIHGEANIDAFGHKPDFEQNRSTYRKKTKNGVFSKLYLGSPISAAAAMGTTLQEAEAFHNALDVKFAGSAAYVKLTIQEIEELGYSETIYGHRRHLPHIKSSRYKFRLEAQREGYNHRIQSGCATIMKRAMVNTWNRMKAYGMRSMFFIQVHDELVFDAVPEEIPVLWEILHEEFARVPEFAQPRFLASIGIGPNWLYADKDEDPDNYKVEEDGSNLDAIINRAVTESWWHHS